MSRTAPERRVKARWIAWALVLAGLAFASVSWFSFAADLWLATSRIGIGVVEGLQLDQAEWRGAFWRSLIGLLNPFWLLRLLAGWHYLLFLAVVGGAAWSWIATGRSGEPARPLLTASLALLPLVLGIGMVPWEIRTVFGALAAAGISDAAMTGAGVAEACAPAGLGLVLSVLLAAWRRGPQGRDRFTDG